VEMDDGEIIAALAKMLGPMEETANNTRTLGAWQ